MPPKSYVPSPPPVTGPQYGADQVLDLNDLGAPWLSLTDQQYLAGLGQYYNPTDPAAIQNAQNWNAAMGPPKSFAGTGAPWGWNASMAPPPPELPAPAKNVQDWVEPPAPAKSNSGLMSLYDPAFSEATPRTGVKMAPNVASGPALSPYLTPAKLQDARQQMTTAAQNGQQAIKDWQTGSTTRNGVTVPNSAIADTYRAGQIGRGGLARLFRQ